MDGRDAIRIANEEVSITKACSLVGLDIGEYVQVSRKLYCPFGHVYHLDGGGSKSFRVYPATNSCYCFAGCGYFSPVKLIAWDRDLPEEQAAEFLLEEIGYSVPDYAERWVALMTETPPVNTADLAEALKVACQRMNPRWESIQFDEDVSDVLAKCLGLLRKVATEEDATKWLSITKQAMARVLGEG